LSEGLRSRECGKGDTVSTIHELRAQARHTHCGRSGVLTGDEVAVDDDLNTPVLDSLENSAKLDKFGLEQEGDERLAVDGRLLRVGESGKVLALDDGLAVGEDDVLEDLQSKRAVESGTICLCVSERVGGDVQQERGRPQPWACRPRRTLG
jgi:hypothetical protein